MRGWNVTSAAAYDGAQLRNVLKRANTGSTVWADTAYRSKKNEEWLEKNGYVSDIHQKKPKGRPMSEATSRANGRRSKTRAFVEHVFAQLKSRMGLFVRTIGIARARTKIGMAKNHDLEHHHRIVRWPATLRAIRALQRLAERLAENLPRHDRVQLLQRIAGLAQPDISLVNVPETSLSPHPLPPRKSTRRVNQNSVPKARYFKLSNHTNVRRRSFSYLAPAA
ncbi:transposase [Mesorhizobium sp.]|uniref:transposase n=1 Tax=Mesorhizobium sp. TaxID=1871066 RepID=UPI00257E0F34|nr:transposase [Mesorhizobium sp.]